MSEIIDIVEVAIPGPAGDASPEMIAAAETRASIIVDSMDLPGQASQDVADAVAAANIPGLVQSEVNAADIPGQVEDAIASSETVQDAVNLGIDNADIPQLAQDAVSSAGGGLLAAQRAQVYAVNRVPNPMGVGVESGHVGGNTIQVGVRVQPGQFVEPITTGLPEGFSHGVKFAKSFDSNPQNVINIATFGDRYAGDFEVKVTPGEVISAGAFNYIGSYDSPEVTEYLSRLRVVFWDVDGVQLSIADSSPSTAHVPDTWEWRERAGITVPANAARAGVEAVFNINGTLTASAGAESRMTGAILKKGASISPDDYGDGTRRLWNFTGVAHKSPSVRVFRTDEEEQLITDLIGGERSAPLIVSISGSDIIVTERVSGKALITTLRRNGSANGGLNIQSIVYDGVQSQQANDDITPIRTQLGTVGANHGFTTIGIFDNPDGKTVADIGSIYTDGTREYVLLDIANNGKLKVGGSYLGGVSEPTTIPAFVITQNLTHVSGGVHVAPIDYSTFTPGSSSSRNDQLSPGTAQRHRLSVRLDGEPISGDGDYYGSVLTLSESYAIVDYKSLYDLAKANPGTAITQLGAKAAVQVQNTWEWRGSGVLQIQHSLDELAPTTLNACGAVQAQPLDMPGMTLYRRVPGMGVEGGRDWSAGVDMTSYSSTVHLNEGLMISDREVPAFHIDVLEASGSPYLGFAMGYLPNRKTSDARGEARMENAPTGLWDMRATKKAYPVWTTGEAAGWGHREVSAYRVHLAPAQIQRVLAMSKSATESVAALLAESGLPVD